MFLRQSTSVIVHVGPVVAVGDGFTPLSTMVLSAADETELLKGNTSATVNISANTCSPIVSGRGWYALSLSSGNVDTVGTLTVAVNDDSLMLPVFARFQVLAQAIYDALFGASAAAFDANQDVTVGGHAAGSFTSAAWAASAIIATAISAGAITSAKIATDAITSAQVAAGTLTSAKFAASAIVSSIISANALVSAHLSANAISKIQAELALSSGVIVSSILANAITASALSADAAAEVATAVWAESARTITGVTAAGLADFFDTNSGTTYSAAVAGSVVKEIADNAGGASLTASTIVDAMFTTNAGTYSGTAVASSVVKQIADNAGGASLTDSSIAGAVWDLAQSAHVAAGSFGEVATEIASILNDTGTSGVVVSSINANAITSGVISAGALTSAQFAASAITSAILAANALTTATFSAGAMTSSRFGSGFLTSGLIAANALVSAAISADAITKIQAGLATSAVLATVSSDVAAILVDTGTTLDTAIADLPTNAELATALAAADDAVLAAIAALNNLSAAQVNAEVVDALATDTYAEPTGVPAATASLASKIGRLHEALRNRVDVTATKKTFYDDAGVALWEKDLSDDATTYSESEGNLP